MGADLPFAGDRLLFEHDPLVFFPNLGQDVGREQILVALFDVPGITFLSQPAPQGAVGQQEAAFGILDEDGIIVSLDHGLE